MDDQPKIETQPFLFTSPLDGLELRPLTEWGDHSPAEQSAPFVTGKILGVVPTVGWRYDQRHGLKHPYTKWWALVCKSTDEQVAEHVARNVYLEEKIKELLKRSSTAEAKLKDALDGSASWKTSAEDRKKGWDDALEQRNEKVRTLMKIEQDLAKVKKHFGEKAFADALATGK